MTHCPHVHTHKNIHMYAHMYTPYIHTYECLPRFNLIFCDKLHVHALMHTYKHIYIQSKSSVPRYVSLPRAHHGQTWWNKCRNLLLGKCRGAWYVCRKLKNTGIYMHIYICICIYILLERRVGAWYVCRKLKNTGKFTHTHTHIYIWVCIQFHTYTFRQIRYVRTYFVSTYAYLRNYVTTHTWPHTCMH